MNSKISVVIPAYNSEKTIARALHSVIQQSMAVYEIIVVNDGSSDNTKSIVEDIITSQPDIRIKLLNQSNKGVSTARNLGIHEAQGEWIAFLDSDDYWKENKIARQVEIIKSNQNIDLLGSAKDDILFRSTFIQKIELLTKISSKTLLFKNFLSPPTVIMKRSIVDEIGFFDETQKFAEEGDFWIRICQKNNCYIVNESLVCTDDKPYFGHSGLSGNLKEMEKGELKNLKKALKMRVINHAEYFFLVLFSIAKYIRRLLLVKLQK